MVSMPTPATKCMKCSDRGLINCSTEPEECAECEDECRRCISGSACLSNICYVWYKFEIEHNPYYENNQQPNCPHTVKVKGCDQWSTGVHCIYGIGWFNKKYFIQWFPYLLKGNYYDPMLYAFMDDLEPWKFSENLDETISENIVENFSFKIVLLILFSLFMAFLKPLRFL